MITRKPTISSFFTLLWNFFFLVFYLLLSLQKSLAQNATTDPSEGILFFGLIFLEKSSCWHIDIVHDPYEKLTWFFFSRFYSGSQKISFALISNSHQEISFWFYFFSSTCFVGVLVLLFFFFFNSLCSGFALFFFFF